MEDEDNFSDDSDLFGDEDNDSNHTTSVFLKLPVDDGGPVSNVTHQQETFLLSFGLSGSKMFHAAFNEISQLPIEMRQKTLVFAHLMLAEARKQSAKIDIYKEMFTQKLQKLETQNALLKHKLSEHETNVQSILQTSVMPQLQELLSARSSSQSTKLQQQLCTCLSDRDSLDRQIRWIESELERRRTSPNNISQTLEKMSLNRRKQGEKVQKASVKKGKKARRKKRNSEDLSTILPSVTQPIPKNSRLDGYVIRVPSGKK